MNSTNFKLSDKYILDKNNLSHTNLDNIINQIIKKNIELIILTMLLKIENEQNNIVQRLEKTLPLDIVKSYMI